ncbi:MAG: IS630 family transposase, partial [Planctomycetaceae bacterium]|nr:IS630 family transposase [Planctomycetaceae bacterium]
KGALDTRFEPEYCREILRRCEFVFTPVHGSWLNIAESELSVLTKQCLCGRIGSMEEVRKQVTTWMTWRNNHAKGIHWQFTTHDARIKWDSVYPKFHFDNE